MWQGCSVPASSQVVVRDQVCGYQVFFFRAGDYMGETKSVQRKQVERRNYFSKFVLHCQRHHWALSWFCLELNQSKFRNVGFIRCGFCCCSFPDSRFFRLILSEFHSYIVWKQCSLAYGFSLMLLPGILFWEMYHTELKTCNGP